MHRGLCIALQNVCLCNSHSACVRTAGVHLRGREIKANNAGLWIIYPVTEGQTGNLFRLEFENIEALKAPLLTLSLRRVPSAVFADLAMGTVVQLRKVLDPPLPATARVRR
ncbi:hypothetical protein CRM22_001421, partial [Opisthorchis felineus]